MKNWPKPEASEQMIGPSDFVVGDNGNLYQLEQEQYTDPGDFLRVRRLNRKLIPAPEVSGQHASCVVKIAREEALGLSKEQLQRYHDARRISRAEEFRERRRHVEAAREKRMR